MTDTPVPQTPAPEGGPQPTTTVCAACDAEINHHPLPATCPVCGVDLAATPPLHWPTRSPRHPALDHRMVDAPGRPDPRRQRPR